MREAARGDRAAIAQARAHVRKRMAADAIDGRRPALFLQRLARLGKRRALDDVRRTQFAQPRGFFGTAGRCNHAIAAFRQNRHREAADAAIRARHQHVAIVRADAVFFQRLHAQHRGIACGADGHRLARRDVRGQRNQMIGRHARFLREPAPMRFAGAPAVHHDLVAGLVIRMRTRFDDTREVDAGHHRPRAHDRGFARDRESVFVIERGEVDAHEHIATVSGCSKASFVDQLNGCDRAVVLLFENESFEHRRTPLG
ncbi:hypothetical protein AWB82_07205 [Caballeronia glebae]|uniref:Uncharacterized protein n=1 Tax=Caballeronia glebae TaxID=1777143 RepID=A0A158DV17_9BURK|nr:hypothetical protein AWB82_07205 [Caballeronia glebae]